MKEFNLYAKLRETSTMGDLNKLRNQGFVPAVVYGGKKNLNVYCFINDLNDLINTTDIYKVNLKVENKIYHTIVKDVQYHPLKDTPTHIDFMEVDKDTVVKMLYPIHFVGTPVGARQGGKIYRKLKKLHLKGKLGNMPEIFQLDISGLDIGESLRIRDLKVQDLEILDQESVTIVNVSRPKVIEEPTAEETAAAASAATATPATTTPPVEKKAE
jgi:large subunit ribosomal protein L25